MVMGMPAPKPADGVEIDEHVELNEPPRRDRTMIMGMPAPKPADGEEIDEQVELNEPPRGKAAGPAMPLVTRFPAPPKPSARLATPPLPEVSATDRTQMMGVPAARAGESMSVVALRLELRVPPCEQCSGKVVELLATRSALVARAVAIVAENSGWLQKSGPEGLTFLWDLVKSDEGTSVAVRTALQLVRETLAGNAFCALRGLPPLTPVAAVAAGTAVAEVAPRVIRISGDPMDESSQLALKAAREGVFVTDELAALLSTGFRVETRPCQNSRDPLHEVVGPKAT
jgi:hypothetical protein